MDLRLVGKIALPLLILLFLSGISFASPEASVDFAYQDAAKTLATGGNPKGYLYFSAHNFPEKDWPNRGKDLSFVVNSLSRSVRMYKPVHVGGGVFRVDSSNYQWPTSAIELLAEKGSNNVPQPEPYYNLRVVKLVPKYKEEKWGYYKDRENKTGWVTTRTEKVKVGEEKEITLTYAPWASPEKQEKLYHLTGHKYPILRLDWFCNYGFSAPAYYRFLGLDPDKGLEKDFDDLVKADIKRAEESVVKGVTDTKIVALHNRILVRVPTVNSQLGGYRWESNDTDTGADDEDYLEQLLKPKVKAKEIIASLANGLQAYALSNAEGKLAQVAPVTFARDLTSGFHDVQVWNGRNCAICHSNGIIELDDQVRALAQKRVVLQVKDNKGKDKKKIDLLLSAFEYDLGKAVEHDRKIYEDAVFLCTGREAKVNATSYRDLCLGYARDPLSLSDVCIEAGISEDKLVPLLKQGARLHSSLVGIIQDPPLPIDRIRWENKGFASLMLYLHSQHP